MRAYAILGLTALLAACGPNHSAKSAGASGSSSPAAASAAAQMDKAAPMTVGATVSGEMVSTGASKFYRLDYPGKVRDIVVVHLENKSSTLKPDIKLYNADRSGMTEKYDGTPGANAEISLTMNPGQVIYVEVMPYNSSGAYQLSAIAKKAYDANEANDDILTATPVKFGDSIEGSIMDDKDNDYFHVSAPMGGKVDVVLENLSTTLKPDVKVFNAMKSQVVEKDNGTPGADLAFTVDVDAGRDFYVAVVPWGSAGKYRITTRASVQAADMASALKAKGLIDLYGVYFDTDQTAIKEASGVTLGEVAALMKADPSLKLEVSGHTDNTGDKAHNMTLSQGRAEAVVAWLVGQYKIDASRLVAKGYGDTKPVGPNDTDANKAKNRRVELKKL